VSASWVTIVTTSALIGVGSNLDNTGVGLAFGAAGVRVPAWVNVVINAIGFCFVTAACFATATVRHYLSAQTAARLAAGALIAVALVCWYTGYVHHRLAAGRKPMKIRQPGWHEAIVLGFGLSFTNLVGGFSATLADPRMIWPTVAAITVAGYLAISIGNALARGLLAPWLGRFSPLVAGLILIGVGIHELV
jgi:putative Mn2+ efflux pump MntP